MNYQTFFKTFKHSLSVGEPKRSEILSELKSHLSDNRHEELGNPKSLAKEYDRVHIGFFYKLWRIMIIPVAYSIIISFVLTLYVNGSVEELTNFTRDAAWRYIYGIQFIIVPLIAIWLIAIFQKYYKPKRAIISLMIISFISFSWSTYIINLPLPSWEESRNLYQFSLFIFLQIQWIIPFVLIAYAYTWPIASSFSDKTVRGRRRAELIATPFAGLFLYWYSSIIGESALAPYDMVLPENRPPIGTIARSVNDFFEQGMGLILFTVLTLAIFAFFVTIRQLKYREILGEKTKK